MRSKILLVIVLLCLSAMGIYYFTRPEPLLVQPEHRRKPAKENLMEINAKRHEIEDKRIDDYVKEKGLSMIKTGTGLRYYVDEPADEKVYAKDKDLVLFDFICLRLNGDTLYRSSAEKTGQVRINADQSVSGLHQALTKIGLSEKATIIIPSHLAHGLHGDDRKIGAWETLVYQVKINEIIKNNESPT